jgi:hypothetical protein
MPASSETHSTVAKGNAHDIPRQAHESGTHPQIISARIVTVIPSEMFPPLCCDSGVDQASRRRHHKSRKMAMLTLWRDSLERQLAAVTAAMDTLQRQIDRDAQSDS